MFIDQAREKIPASRKLTPRHSWIPKLRKNPTQHLHLIKLIATKERLQNFHKLKSDKHFCKSEISTKNNWEFPNPWGSKKFDGAFTFDKNRCAKKIFPSTFKTKQEFLQNHEFLQRITPENIRIPKGLEAFNWMKLVASKRHSENFRELKSDKNFRTP